MIPLERARLLYRTMEAFGWDVRWRSDNPIPDDAWPIDLMAKAIEKAEARGRAAGLEEAAREADDESECEDGEFFIARQIGKRIRALADPSPAMKGA